MKSLAIFSVSLLSSLLLLFVSFIFYSFFETKVYNDIFIICFLFVLAHFLLYQFLLSSGIINYRKINKYINFSLFLVLYLFFFPLISFSVFFCLNYFFQITSYTPLDYGKFGLDLTLREAKKAIFIRETIIGTLAVYLTTLFSGLILRALIKFSDWEYRQNQANFR